MSWKFFIENFALGRSVTHKKLVGVIMVSMTQADHDVHIPFNGFVFWTPTISFAGTVRGPLKTETGLLD